MLLVALGLHEVLVDHLAQVPPPVAVGHDKQMVKVGDGVGDNGLGAVGVEVALAVNEVLDELTVREDNGGVLEALEGVDATILLSPLGEAIKSVKNCTHDVCKCKEAPRYLLKMGTGRGHLELVSKEEGSRGAFFLELD